MVSICSSRNQELLPELGPMLESIAEACPAGAARAGLTLGLLCRPWLKQIRSGLPLHTSLLTPGGYPLEFAFGARSQEISYTAEPGLPQSPLQAKWRFLREVVRDLDLHTHPLLRELVAQPSQRFGCWLGVRHRGDITSLKVYQEVGPGASDLALRYLRSDVPDLAEAVSLKPTLLGVVPGASGLTEYYCRIRNPNLGVLHKLFAAAGAARQLPCVIDYIAYLAGEQRNRLWDRIELGISYCVSSEPQSTVTLFATANQLFPTERSARARLLGLARQFGIQMPAYDRITRSFEKGDPPHPVHGLVGIKVTRSGRLEWSAGLRPFG
jgi:hypothetical protein